MTMRLRSAFSLLLVTPWIAPSLVATGNEPSTARPNIVMVFIDDMGWEDFSCFGNQDAKTPNVDLLASEGIRFSQFYVNSPICSPSRCALTTGQYPQRWKITSFLSHRADNARRGVANWLDPQAPTLARILHDNGYATGHFGKWHLGGQRDVDDAPPIAAYGFDESLTNFEGMGAKLLPLTLRPGDSQPGKIWADAERLGHPVTWMQRSKITGGFVDAAVPFIDRASKEGKPFYINLWPDDVHSPFWPPVHMWANGKRGLYLSVLQEMDRQLGKLFDHIRDNPALRDNTLILVCSDNGHEPGAGRSGPFRGAKTRLYEGGVRSPLVVWGPGLMPAEKRGTHNESSVFAAFDLVPSLLKLADLKVPADVTFDGEEIAATLVGKGDASRVAPIHWRRPPDRKNSPPALLEPQPDLAVRDGKWKLLCDYDGSNPELYDLSKDLGEKTNLVDRQPDLTKRLTAAVVAWHQSMPADNGPELGAKIKKKNAAVARPNFLLIIADDCTYSDLEVYGGQAKTPHLNQLAAEGMKFNRCFQAAPMCSPTRHCLYTGLYPVKSGAYPNHTMAYDWVKSIAHHLQTAGYSTHLSGKTHINPKSVFPFKYSGKNNPDPDAFSAVLKQSAEANEPFLFIAASNEPHSPWTKGDASQYPPQSVKLPPVLVDSFDTREAFSRYLAEITYFDSQVGELVDLLDQSPLKDNTLVMVLSEQGNSFPFAKWTCYDAGLQSGCIVRWSGRVAAGSVCDALIEYVDVVPTFLAAAGIAPPKNLDGLSLIPVLTGAATSHKLHVFGLQTTRGIIKGSDFFGIRSVRDERYRYIRNLTPDVVFRNVATKAPTFVAWQRMAAEGDAQAKRLVHNYQHRPAEELYDCEADPWNQTNLAGRPEHAKRLAMLRTQLDGWMKEQGDEGQATELKALERMPPEPFPEGQRGKSRPAADRLKGSNLLPPRIHQS